MAVLQVIEWADQAGREMVRRVPERGSGEIRLGSQLVVREGQVAVFFRDGRALDIFGPGRHTLSTMNLPIIDRLFKLPFGESPFKAEVYFVSMKQFTDMKWGTPQPITLRDADLGMVRLRAFGSYGMQIMDPGLFVNTIVGTRSLYETREIEDYLRAIIVSRLTDILGGLNVPFLDLPARFSELGAAIKARVRDEFAALGIELRGFYVENVSPTEETQKAIDERASMGAIGDMDAYLRYKAARAMGDAANNPGAAGDTTGAGVGMGMGIGMGAMMAQILGQSAQHQAAQQQPPTAPAAPPAAPSGGGGAPAAPAAASAPAEMAPTDAQSVELAFTGIELLVGRQLAVPQEERNAILQKLATMEVEFAKDETDLMTIKQMRQEINQGWPWLAPELDVLFRQPVIEREMADAARRFMSS